MKCENQLCGRSFQRMPKDISPHNYCSQSCAAVVNNKKYPKWHSPPRVCAQCSKEYKGWGKIYCSVICRKKAWRPYTKESLIPLVQYLGKKLGRIPGKRENRELSERCVKVFGSWNKAIVAAGLEPNRSHNDRMYKRSMTRAADGHICDSVSEALIDNWLSEHGIAHERNAKYPTTNHRADWQLQSGAFVEYFGLAKDSPRYDRAVLQKQRLCEQYEIDLISLYPDDLYPKISLQDKLGSLLGR